MFGTTGFTPPTIVVSDFHLLSAETTSWGGRVEGQTDFEEAFERGLFNMAAENDTG